MQVSLMSRQKSLTTNLSRLMDELRILACTAAQKAGDVIMELYTTTAFDTKTDGSPVTIADHAANDQIFTYLRETNIPILSEETTGMELPYPRRLWIIDPLDGTRDFIQKTGDFSVMIGLIEDGEPVLGVVYAPVTRTLYYATRGGGAFSMNSEGVVSPLAIPEVQHASKIRAIRSRNHHGVRASAVFEHLEADIVDPRGSVGIKAVVIAGGNADLYIVSGSLGEWDTCAPELILREAGGYVSDFDGNPLRYGASSEHKLKPGTLFTHPTYRETVLEALRVTP